MRSAWAVAAAFALAGFAGCVTPGSEADFTFDHEVYAVAEDGVLSVELSFTNTGDQTFVAQSAHGCLFADVWVEVHGVRVDLDSTYEALADCVGTPTEHKVAPGETRLFYENRLALSEQHGAGGGPLFSAGNSYPIHARLEATQLSWVPGGNAFLHVTSAGDLPHLELQAEPAEWPQGQTGKIVATLHNTAARAFTYTSSDTCNDLRVWVEDTKGEGTETFLVPNMEGFGCGDAETDFRIEPGETYTWTVHWDGSQDTEGGAPFVDPGLYVVHAMFDGSGHAWETAGLGTVGILAAS